MTNTEFDKIKMLQPYENNLNLQFQTNDLVVSKPLLGAIKLPHHLSSSIKPSKGDVIVVMQENSQIQPGLYSLMTVFGR